MSNNLACIHIPNSGSTEASNLSEARDALDIGSALYEGCIVVVNHDHRDAPSLLSMVQQHERRHEIAVVLASDLPDVEAESLCKRYALNAYVAKESVGEALSALLD